MVWYPMRMKKLEKGPKKLVVKDLVAALQTLPPDMEVMVFAGSGTYMRLETTGQAHQFFSIWEAWTIGRYHKESGHYVTIAKPLSKGAKKKSRKILGLG